MGAIYRQGIGHRESAEEVADAVITVSIRQVRIAPVLVNAGRKGLGSTAKLSASSPDTLQRLGNLSGPRSCNQPLGHAPPPHPAPGGEVVP